MRYWTRDCCRAFVKTETPVEDNMLIASKQGLCYVSILVIRV